jgi:hypothetical protein
MLAGFLFIVLVLVLVHCSCSCSCSCSLFLFLFLFWLLLDGLVVCAGDETSGGKSSSGVKSCRESKLAVRKGRMMACWGSEAIWEEAGKTICPLVIVFVVGGGVGGLSYLKRSAVLLRRGSEVLMVFVRKLLVPSPPPRFCSMGHGFFSRMISSRCSLAVGLTT